MNAPIDALAFAAKFEGAGFDHGQARARASAFAEAGKTIRSSLVTKDHLDLRLTGLEARRGGQMGELNLHLNRQIGELELRMTRHIGEIGKDVSNRLWSTVAIIAGVSTAIGATIGAGVALLLKLGGL